MTTRGGWRILNTTKRFSTRRVIRSPCTMFPFNATVDCWLPRAVIRTAEFGIFEPEDVSCLWKAIWRELFPFVSHRMDTNCSPEVKTIVWRFGIWDNENWNTPLLHIRILFRKFDSNITMEATSSLPLMITQSRCGHIPLGHQSRRSVATMAK